MNLNIPHGGPGTHTLAIAIEIPDDRLADDDLLEQILARCAELVRPVLARRRAAFVGEAFLAARGYTLDQLRAHDRTRDITRARQDLCLLLRRHDWSYSAIGRLLCRDHSTVVHACKVAEAREHDREGTCRDCDRPALGGGIWCLLHYQQNRRAS
jgi:hypothetical protein